MISVFIGGDTCLNGRAALLSTQQLLPLFEDIKPIIQSADKSLINLETSVVESEAEPIAKAGPSLKTDSRILDMLKAIGVTGVTLANNHFADYGSRAVAESLQLLDKYGLWHVGAGLNEEEAAKTKTLAVGGKSVSVINCCEHEFTVATAENAGCNALNVINIYHRIIQAKKTSDYVLVIVHGGHEHYQLPSPRMQETYRFFVEAGADAVINHHQHCYSGYEIYNGKPIVYGIGNFFFDMDGQEEKWNEGYAVKLLFDKDVELELIPYVQNKKQMGIILMRGEEKEKFLQNIDELNNVIQNKELLQRRLVAWAESRKKEYYRFILPSKGRNIKMLERFHLIPRGRKTKWNPEYLTKQRKLLLKSLFQCESHQEIMNILLNLDNK